MANDEHVALLKQGVAAWNTWRRENRNVRPDLRQADLRGRNLRNANLSGADLRGAILRNAKLGQASLNSANLYNAILVKADLTGAKLKEAMLRRADLSGAILRKADFSGGGLFPGSGADLSAAVLNKADLSGADLRKVDLNGAKLHKAKLFHAKMFEAGLSGAELNGAKLCGADLRRANLVGTVLKGADLTGCHVFGASAWGLRIDTATVQKNLLITPEDEPAITVDNIEVAQFIYLLLNNQKLRNVIDTITSKAVLILGRFTNEERKAVLDALREELRKRDYLPILFDFAVPATRDITETVSLLARMARFIIADLTDPSSIPKELEAIVPDLAVPVQPLLEGASRPYAMFKDYWKYEWVLPVYRYEGLEPLLATLAEKVIAPAEGKVKGLEERRRRIEAELAKVE
jgi:uncharacterized protein YjbI with pentapeptide repeats